MADIFISYKREDRKKAELLARRLAMSGWTVWWDHELLGGEDYDVIIGRELSQAKAVVVIWSAASVLSRNVKDEASKALKREVLVPVSFDSTEPPLGFGMTHVIIFENPSKVSAEEYDKVYESIKKKAGLPGAVPAVVTGGDEKRSFPVGLIIGIVAALAIIAFLVFRGRDNTNSTVNITSENNAQMQGDTASFNVVVKETKIKQVALTRLTLLKTYERNAIMYSNDSITYKIAEPFRLPLSDTSKVLDSLKRYYSSGKIYIEVQKAKNRLP